MPERSGGAAVGVRHNVGRSQHRNRFAPSAAPTKFASPPYEAVIAWEPTLRVDVVNVAAVTPLVVVSVPEPEGGRAVLESHRSGRAPRAGLEAATVAVNVTGWPKAEGFELDVSVVVSTGLKLRARLDGAIDVVPAAHGTG